MQRMSIMAALAFLLLDRSALADVGCAGPDIAIDAPAARHWPSALDFVRKHIEMMEGVDRCARVDVVSSGSDIVVVVTLRDGRTATRRAAKVEDLGAILDALLLLPDVSSSEIAPSAEEPTRPPPNAPAVTDLPPATTANAPPPLTTRHSQTEPAAMGFEIGIGAGGRLAGGPFHGGASITACANVFHGLWRLGVTGRTDLVDAPARSVEGEHVEIVSSAIGVLAGPRLQAGRFDIDLAVGASLVAQEQEVHDHRGHEHELSPRLMATVRVLRGNTSIRPYVAMDGELGNPTASDAPAAPFTDWPFWSVGLAGGLSWSPP